MAVKRFLVVLLVIGMILNSGCAPKEQVMVTLTDLKNAIDGLKDTVLGAIAVAKITPKQIVTVQGLSDIDNSLGTIRAGQFIAASSGTEPTRSDFTGSFLSALGHTFGTNLFHIGGVKDGDLKWGANALTGELEAGDGAVRLTENGVSVFDDSTEVARLGNLNGFLGYSSDTYGLALGDSDQYMTYDPVNGLKVYGALTTDREILTANKTYYVRTDGNDSNNGLSNTSGGAFLTIQKAIDTASLTLDTRQYSVIIRIADGTYSSTGYVAEAKSLVGDGLVYIIGNTTTPANVVFEGTSTYGSGIKMDNIKTVYSVEGVKFTSTSGFGLYILGKSIIRIGNVNFGACGGTHMSAMWGAKIQLVSSYTISGASQLHMYADQQSHISIDRLSTSSITVTLSGTPAFTLFVYASGLSLVYAGGITYSGSATGQRYYVNANSVIGTDSGNVNFFPGNSAGGAAAGGEYY